MHQLIYKNSNNNAVHKKDVLTPRKLQFNSLHIPAGKLGLLLLQ